MSAIYDLSGRIATTSMSQTGRQGQNVIGIGEAASAAAVGHIAVVSDSGFRIPVSRCLSGPVVGP